MGRTWPRVKKVERALGVRLVSCAVLAQLWRIVNRVLIERDVLVFEANVVRAESPS